MYDAPGDYTLSFLTKDGLVETSSLYYCIHCLNKYPLIPYVPYLSPMEKIIVLVAALAIIYYIGKEVLGTFRHLSDEELADFWAGRTKKTDPKAQGRFSEHLGRCTTCRDRLDEIRKSATGPGADAPLIERKY
jgi:hypothetical protein